MGEESAPIFAGLPERIVLCLDVSDEMGSVWDPKDQQPHTRMEMLTTALQHFVKHKASMNPEHSFAICTLGDEVEWIMDFTTETSCVVDVLESLDVQAGCVEEYDFSPLLCKLEEKSTSGEGAGLVRAIVVFGRSCSVPTISSKPSLRVLHRDDVFMDFLYVHHRIPRNDEAANGVLKCQEVYDFLMDMVGDSSSAAKHCYHLEQAQVLSRLNSNLAALLTHAGQRCRQDDFTKTIDYIVGQQEVKNREPEGGMQLY